MKTAWISLSEEIEEKKIKQAVAFLKAGEVVAFPTETVYGLGADATNEAAIEKIFVAKGRPSDNPLIVHIAEERQLDQLVKDVPLYVFDLMKHFSPGPITYILPSKGAVAGNVTAGLQTLAVRIPNHPIALEILRESMLPIAAPSANTSGKPSPTSAQHVREDLDGKIASIVDGGATAVGLESTVVDCTGDIPVILRLGMITKEAICRLVGHVDVYDKHVVEQEQPKSPGLKYKHYAPDVPLVLVTGGERKLQAAIDEQVAKNRRVGVLASDAIANEISASYVVRLGKTDTEIATHLYKGLRSFNQEKVDIIFCESFQTSGIGAAIMDRLTRAATKVI